MQVIHVPENGKAFVPYDEDGSIIVFGDDEIMVNLKVKERDYDVTIDICRDLFGGLILSPAGARAYVAQIFIPARQYTENPDSYPEPVPFSMDNVVLTIYEEV